MTSVVGLLEEIAGVGRDRTRGGYTRALFDDSERELREWFIAHAEARGLDVHTDRNGLIWAWWWPKGAASSRKRVVTGSHLDSVPGGGAFDGPLGICSALAAVDELTARGHRPARPLGIAVFPEEEGSRFGVACLGSRLMTGAIAADDALALKDVEGDTFADVAARNGLDPRRIGTDHETLGSIDRFVELHVEQGRGLIDLDQPVGIATSIIAHGRWQLTIRGQGNHAGATLMTDRRDPMVTAARVVHEVRQIARTVPGARATVGRMRAIPGAVNVIASQVDLWIDARHPDDEVLQTLMATIGARADSVAAEEACAATLVQGSIAATKRFDREVSRSLQSVVPDAPPLESGAGHDAGILAEKVPSAMLFVRNPSGVSHSPEEHVESPDAEHGARVLADVLAAATEHLQ